jgi:transcription termination factor NusB
MSERDEIRAMMQEVLNSRTNVPCADFVQEHTKQLITIANDVRYIAIQMEGIKKQIEDIDNDMQERLREGEERMKKIEDRILIIETEKTTALKMVAWASATGGSIVGAFFTWLGTR